MSRSDSSSVLLLIQDGQERKLERELHATLGDAIRDGEGASERRVVVGLRVDGVEVDPEAIELRLEGGLDGVRRAEVVTRGAREIALGGLESASSYAGAVREGVAEAAAKLREGRVPEANRLLADALDALGVLVFAVGAARREIGESCRALDGLEEALAPWLGAVLPAHESADWIRVADLLEYEIAPIVESWRERLVTAHAEEAVR